MVETKFMEDDQMQGKLYFDKETGRYSFRYIDSDGELQDYGGIHCGEGFEVLLNDVWVPTRMEMSGEWYFVGLSGLKLDGLTVRR